MSVKNISQLDARSINYNIKYGISPANEPVDSRNNLANIFNKYVIYHRIFKPSPLANML